MSEREGGRRPIVESGRGSKMRIDFEATSGTFAILSSGESRQHTPHLKPGATIGMPRCGLRGEPGGNSRSTFTEMRRGLRRSSTGAACPEAHTE